MKPWPLTLIKRGVKVGTTSKYPDTIWWQETNPEAPTADAARRIGYEAHALVPVAYPERIAGSAENLLRTLNQYTFTEETQEQIEDLQRVIDSYHDNVVFQKQE